MARSTELKLLSATEAVPVFPAAPSPGERSSAPPFRGWSFETLTGRISELCASPAGATLTATAWIVREAQKLGEPAAWIAAGDSAFFPQDFHDFGVDLEALAVIRVPGCLAGARATEHLLRSGAFGLVVLDLEEAANASAARRGAVRAMPPLLPTAAQTRLAALCRKHHAALLCLTRGAEGSSAFGSLISLRGEGAVRKTAFDRYALELHILKDKRQGPGWSHTEVCRGPDGLC